MKGEEVENSGFSWWKLIAGIILVGFFLSIWYMIFRYVIRGERDGDCLVEVELLRGELNNADSMRLEGHTMECRLPFGVVVAPESDISVCHGLLKEGLQDLVIRKLHTYLVQNLGRLNLEMAGLPKG